jgi:hypothetical protein
MTKSSVLIVAERNSLKCQLGGYIEDSCEMSLSLIIHIYFVIFKYEVVFHKAVKNVA